MKPFYKSEKFWIFVTSIMGLIGTVIAGEQSVSQVIPQFISFVLGYMGLQVADKKIPDKAVKK